MAVITLTMITNKTPHWSNMASTVETSQPTLQGRVSCDRHATLPHTSSATIGMRQKSETTTLSGGAGTRHRSAITSNRK